MARKKKKGKKKLIAYIQQGQKTDRSQLHIRKSGRVLFATDTQEFTENTQFFEKCEHLQ